MSFRDKYPKRPVVFLQPSPVEVEPGVWQGFSYWSCDVCSKRTEFFIHFSSGSPGTPCCSEECKATSDRRTANEQEEEPPEADVASPVPPIALSLLDVLMSPPA